MVKRVDSGLNGDATKMTLEQKYTYFTYRQTITDSKRGQDVYKTELAATVREIISDTVLDRSVARALS